MCSLEMRTALKGCNGQLDCMVFFLLGLSFLNWWGGLEAVCYLQAVLVIQQKVQGDLAAVNALVLCEETDGTGWANWMAVPRHKSWISLHNILLVGSASPHYVADDRTIKSTSPDYSCRIWLSVLVFGCHIVYVGDKARNRASARGSSELSRQPTWKR